MISKNRIRFIVSLQNKRVRNEERLYVIEGDKLVREYLESGIAIRLLAARPEFINSLTSDRKDLIEEIETADYDDLEKISTLKSPHNAIAVVPFPEYRTGTEEILESLCVALDFIQDPGNLGTIFRAAAWFGIKNIVCGENCVDVFNPKVVRATMGAILNVRVFYYDLKGFLAAASEKGLPVYGTLLEGESVYSHPLGNLGIILIGNESKGISGELIPFISEKLVIPKMTRERTGVESLNAGMAASIIFSEFARRYYFNR